MGRTATERRVARLGTKRPWTEQDAREVLAALEASAESVAAFAGRVGIVPQRLLWWRSRLGRSSGSFVPVEVTSSGPAVVLTMASGTRIEVSAADAASAQWVATVMRAMRPRARRR